MGGILFTLYLELGAVISSKQSLHRITSRAAPPKLNKKKMEELSHDDQQLIRDAFGIMDKEGEGAITSKELAVVIRALGRQPTDNEVQSIINEVDSDGNGSIDSEEFCNVILRKMRDTNVEEELREAFRVFDKENNGYLSTTELKNVYTALGVKVGDDELEEMIREYDLDQDNHLNYEEFVNMMTLR
ncbi:calmodulin-1 [Drosophila bipectinata]|uniref:calmodulin-1 n=1 Tax=Drosophila bipectinata TaxID=42026 RepID=UPI0038B35A75